MTTPRSALLIEGMYGLVHPLRSTFVTVPSLFQTILGGYSHNFLPAGDEEKSKPSNFLMDGYFSETEEFYRKDRVHKFLFNQFWGNKRFIEFRIIPKYFQ
ncbi:hypothetical protein CDAR_128061 [Caerostris darwini]|uniref:Uncharacterized protein n=1 Tax=Caerostris darwini TaxID=1538125 RepID=A0AAV4P2Q5_9ARAC|nr:hypothetical protein CDAR_128061 [Caerostris darwini]